MTRDKTLGPPLDLRQGRIDLSHGAGGRAMAQVIDDVFATVLDNEFLAQGNDQARFPTPDEGSMVMSTDGFVIWPLFFPGGDIGSLAVHGTVNDIAVGGATPLYLSASFIIEEGFPLSDLKEIAESMAQASLDAGVLVVTGDTKVVERGQADGLFITTAGVGVVRDGVDVSGDRLCPGDAVLINGTIGDHGIAVMSKRENLTFDAPVVSDSAALNGLVAAMMDAAPQALKCMRDPTRGGLAATCNELARQSKVGIRIQESAIPIQPAVQGACELFGLDPLNIANEGKLVCICDAQAADTLLEAMRAHPLGRNAARIGTVTEDDHLFVLMETALGGERIVDWLSGDQLPRIC